jgi:histidinol-phosphate aminotransferase
MHPDLADAALRLRIPFSLSLPALWAAAAALADPADIEARRAFISGERERVLAALTRLEGVEPYPSEGNFILMNVAASRRSNDEIIQLAHREKILLRAMGSHRLRGTHVRVTIGLAEQNDRFLNLFGRLFAPGGSLASRSA